MPTSTVENYLKQLCLLQQNQPHELVPMGQLASVMNVAPGTATAMVKTLADSGLVEYEPRGGVRLSDRGRKLALHVLRRHRLVEQFLVTVLGLDWSEVHEEAEELEHAISDKLLEKIDRYLDHPTVDPHGDPIPSARGAISNARLANLTTCALHRTMRVARVLDQEARFLQFVDRHRLTPGTALVVSVRDDAADSVTIDHEQGPSVTIGTAAAEKILVEVV